MKSVAGTMKTTDSVCRRVVSSTLNQPVASGPQQSVVEFSEGDFAQVLIS